MHDNPGGAVAPPRLFVRLVGLTALAILLQAVIAGVFVNQDGHDGWITVHGVVADLTWVTALVTAAYAFRRVRPRGNRRLWLGAALLFLLTLAQTGIGHLITDQGMDGLIVVHVPLALIIFGLATWLSLTSAMARRSTTPSDPYGDRTTDDLSRLDSASPRRVAAVHGGHGQPPHRGTTT